MPRKPRSRPSRRRWLGWLLPLVLIGVAGLALYAVHLDRVIRDKFEGQRWALPARVFARPLELYTGLPLDPPRLVEALDRLGYQQGEPTGVGTYAVRGPRVLVYTRGFQFWDGAEPPRKVDVRFDGRQVAGIYGDEGELPLLRLEPEFIGGFYPASNEDRLLVRLPEVPPALIQALLTLEDRDFYSHHGVSGRAIARALWADLRAGAVVQGGSTLTQQLVKNYFLTADRTVWRKLTEAIMAVLLETHYSKDDILESYLNEVFLGQVGARGVHGVAQGAMLYFGRPLSELDTGQLALLAGMVQAPSYYDPRRHPERATARRNLALRLLGEQGHLTPEQVAAEQAKPLRVAQRSALTMARYPAFLDMVRRQLQRDYPEDVLRNEGLRIFATMDPAVQVAAEAAVTTQGDALAKQRRLPKLQMAAVAADVATGEVLAVVGDRDPRFDGYNRALDARRQIGSLAKPATYLAALSQPGRFNLASPLDDLRMSVRLPAGNSWQPRNAGNDYAGRIPLLRGLAESRNSATVGLGLQVGVKDVVKTLGALGVTRDLPEVPAVMLGAVELTPFEVTRMYLTLAANGFRLHLRSIHAVTDKDGKPLASYPLSVEQKLDPAAVFLVNTALQEVVRNGTARGLGRVLPGLNVAGKTGTTNDSRDSWFAGFTGNTVAAVWVGMDDNSETGLYGASGAMRVWADLIGRLPAVPLTLAQPPGIHWVQAPDGPWLPAAQCPGGFGLPILDGGAPPGAVPCDGAPLPQPDHTDDEPWRWLRRLF
ncbi:MAG: penicillin-binding protein 1B [Immundisolibacter sp.]|uniref:penicillin-binding protein 1B n=1 Tax=Immundisolibacter sp. TaxID=1934948 RepID=UPI003D11DFA8